MNKRLSESLYEWRMQRLKDTADRYEQLPQSFRSLLARAARLPEDKKLARLDELTDTERQTLRAALDRLSSLCNKATPLMVMATPPSLPV